MSKIVPKEIIWVTGATSGLGKALTEQLAAAGHELVISARNEAALATLASQFNRVHALALDVTDEQSLVHAREQLPKLVSHLDRVILNAGTCEYLDIGTPDWSMMERISQVNYLGVVKSFSVAFELLQRSANPHVIGISSMVVQAPFPKAEAYGASKAAVSYFLQALRMDVQASGMDVTVVEPGFIDTPLTKKNPFPMPFLISSETAAARLIGAVMRPKGKRPLQVVFPRRLFYLLKLARYLPRTWIKRLGDQNSYWTHKYD